MFCIGVHSTLESDTKAIVINSPDFSILKEVWHQRQALSGPKVNIGRSIHRQNVFRCVRSLLIRPVIQRLGSACFVEVANEAKHNQGNGGELSQQRISVLAILVRIGGSHSKLNRREQVDNPAAHFEAHSTR